MKCICINDTVRTIKFSFTKGVQYDYTDEKIDYSSYLPGVNVNDVKPSNPQMIKESFVSRIESKKFDRIANINYIVYMSDGCPITFTTKEFNDAFQSIEEHRNLQIAKIFQ